GSFARFERGMDHLLAAGLASLVTVKHPVSTLTADHVDAIRNWSEVRGLRHKFAAEIENRHDGGQAPSLYRLETRKVREVKDVLHTARTGGKRPLPMAECAVSDPDPSAPERLYQCLAGRTTLFVDAVGRASHCVIDREPSFPILEMPWDELWAQMRAWVDQPLPADAPCSGCSLRGGCNNCPARARLATASPFGRDQYHCDLTHEEHGLPPARAGAPRQLSACVA
ncbi:MAG: putative Radical domain protein, partial [Gemmatimonadetes bacterium]|nr:putative Radical domain protein [Gemmatimonadota bacterium]